MKQSRLRSSVGQLTLLLRVKYSNYNICPAWCPPSHFCFFPCPCSPSGDVVTRADRQDVCSLRGKSGRGDLKGRVPGLGDGSSSGSRHDAASPLPCQPCGKYISQPLEAHAARPAPPRLVHKLARHQPRGKPDKVGRRLRLNRERACGGGGVANAREARAHAGGSLPWPIPYVHMPACATAESLLAPPSCISHVSHRARPFHDIYTHAIPTV